MRNFKLKDLNLGQFQLERAELIEIKWFDIFLV